MTTEVAVLNKSAIALAADSAVTVGEAKVYNSALKVFALSKFAPVGIMIFGGAELMGLPWEPLIKSFRTELHEKKYSNLKGYADSFLSYIRVCPYIESSVQKRYTRYLSGVFIREHVLSKLEVLLKRKIEENGSFTEADSIVALKVIVEDLLRRSGDVQRLPDFSEDDEAKLKAQLGSDINKAITDVFENVPLTKSIKQKLQTICVRIHTRDIWTTGISGVVIAGFGEQEIYPSVETYQIELVFRNKLKYKKLPDKCEVITHDMGAAIIPFAQEDVIATFMRGINPELQRFNHDYLTEIFSDLPELLDEKLLEKLPPEDRSKLKERMVVGGTKIVEKYLENLNREVAKTNIQPVINMVGVLPKDELADMAETLVSLTAFKRRMSRDTETVGGPIDVAVISKGDGLVWVKRKHYFPPDLNYAFLQNYLRG